MTRLALLISCSLFVFGAGCASEEADSSPTEPSASEQFESYLAANLSCESDADCVIIGDCGPNADFRAVRADAAEEAYRLMWMREVGTWDGPEYEAVCGGDNLCTIERSMYYCGGYGGPIRPLDDGGAGGDAEADGGTRDN